MSRPSYLATLAVAIFASLLAAFALQEPVQQGVKALGSHAFAAYTAPRPAGSTVKIVGNDGSGSGVHIGRGYIVTAAHVMISILDNKKHHDYAILTDDGKKRSAEILWVNKVYDLALLRTSPKDMNYSAITCRVPKPEEAVSWRGSPLEENFVNGYGTVATAERSDQMWRSFYMISGPIIYGDSGGPVFDRRGRVVGITVGTMTYGKEQSPIGIGMAATTKSLCGLLARQ